MIDLLTVIYVSIVFRTVLVCYLAFVVYCANVPEWYKAQVFVAAAIFLSTAWIIVFNPTDRELLTDLTMIKILATNVSVSLLCIACISLAKIVSNK